jgi:predicted RNA-binding protein with PIN domain
VTDRLPGEPAKGATRMQARTLMNELERLEKKMERKWYDLAMAEQRGQPMHVLERMYDAYLKALDDFVQYQRDLDRNAKRTRLAS